MKFPSLTGRLLIAVPGIALFLAVLFLFPEKWCLFLFSALSALASWEAVSLCCSHLRGSLRIAVSFLAGIAALAVSVYHPLVFTLLVLPTAFIALPVMKNHGPVNSRSHIAGTAFLVILYALGFGILGRLFILGGAWMTLSVLALCWIGDSAAYFTGIAFGRNKLLPAVSPKKSWEGFFGGLAGGTAGCVAVGLAGGFPWLPFLVAGVLGGVAGVAGDLFESAIKRDAGVKDSSGLLLGHGGILDRFDSAVAAAPVCFAVYHLFGLLV